MKSSQIKTRRIPVKGSSSMKITCTSYGEDINFREAQDFQTIDVSKLGLRSLIPSSRLIVKDRKTPRNINIQKSYSQQLPLNSQQTLKQYSFYFNNTEKSEISQKSIIYYFSKRVKNFVQMKQLDDNLGNYKIVIGDQIDFKYEILEIIHQKDSYSLIKVLNHENQQIVAAKIYSSSPKLKNIIQNDQKCIEILQKDRKIMKVLEKFQFRGHDIQIIDLVHQSLSQYIKQSTFRSLNKRVIGKQIINAVQHMQSLNIHFSQLAPDGIMLKMCKYPKIRFIDFTQAQIFTRVPRNLKCYYKTPEIVLGLDAGLAQNVWAIGCLLAEMELGRPLFSLGDNWGIIQQYMQVLGYPSVEFIKFIKDYKPFSAKLLDKWTKQNRQDKSKENSTLSAILTGADQRLANLIHCKFYAECLQWNPQDRITLYQMLEHDWVTDILRTQAAPTQQFIKKRKSRRSITDLIPEVSHRIDNK